MSMTAEQVTALRKPFIEGNIDTWPVPTSDPKAIRRLPS